ncbi:MAG: acyl-ACP--UDP-N-acetylglucosamine O-acyltransferase [Lewinella sp.]|nr:acyl-ACP--UDP-N-acetylglucosamine O-acyltransferase [Lewinella sp.]
MNASYREHSIIHPDAKIGQNVTIGPFCYIDEDVEIGDNTWIGPNVTILAGARIGQGVQIHSGAVVSGVPQDLKFRGEKTTAEIGDYTVVREYVTINRGTAAAKKTVVGKQCLLMAYVHVAHDCLIGDRVILANNVNLAGHVEVDDWAILEGMVAVQQFTHIGQHSFIAGGSLVRKNVPPFIRAAREPLSYIGVNKVGLERRQFSQEQINNIHDIYRVLFVRGQNLRDALDAVEAQFADSVEKKDILDFVRASKAGIVRGLNGNELDED